MSARSATVIPVTIVEAGLAFLVSVDDTKDKVGASFTAVMPITTSFVAVKAVAAETPASLLPKSLTPICKVRSAPVAFRLFSFNDPMYVNEAKEALISATVPCRVKAPVPSKPLNTVAPPDNVRLSVPVGTLKATSSMVSTPDTIFSASTSAMLMVFAPLKLNSVSSTAVTVLGLVKVGASFTATILVTVTELVT